MERIRAFIALNLPLATIDRVAVMQRELRRAAEQAEVRVSWVAPPNLHLTLKFLGEIPVEASHAIKDRLAALLPNVRLGKITLAGLGVFPDATRPRVLWMGVEQGADEVAALAGEVDSGLEQLGFEPSKRAYHAHLTLGRIKAGEAAFWSAWQQERCEPCAPTEVVLYRSILRRRGAEYQALYRYPLAMPGDSSPGKHSPGDPGDQPSGSGSRGRESRSVGRQRRQRRRHQEKSQSQQLGNSEGE